MFCLPTYTPEVKVGYCALAVAGPFLLFPELLAAHLRVPVVGVASFFALALGTWLIRQWSFAFCGSVVLTAALCASAVLSGLTVAPGLRHFSGVALGILSMGVISRILVTQRHLAAMGLWFVGSTMLVCIAGLVGAYITRTKLLLDATQELSTAVYPWLPHYRLGLPGLEVNDGWVNPNALGGTALMLLPVCIGYAAGNWVTIPKRRWLVAASSISALLCIAVIAMTHSRTAIVAAMLTCIVASAFWRRGRRWLVTGVAIALTAAGIQLRQTSEVAPENFSVGVALTRANLEARFHIWDAGIAELQVRPLTGVGINQFHQMRAHGTVESTYVAHAHNTFLQVALDSGILGLAGYGLLLGSLLLRALIRAQVGDGVGLIAAGAGLSLVAVHLWGMGDAIALGAKVGLFQWISAGLILACSAARSEPVPPATASRVP